MSDLPTDDQPDDVGLLAGEYVLGVLDLAEMHAVAARLDREPALAGEVTQWQNRLEPLTALVAPVPVPASLWPRVDVSTGQARPRPTLIWNNARFWQGTTAAATALAAAIAGIAFLRPAPPAPQIYVAALSPLNTPGPSFLAQSAPGGALLIRAVLTVPVDQGKDLQLWALPDGAKAPQSLGVLPATGKIVAAPDLPREKTQLLVSLEPAGGSPTGQPTGPVLLGGTLTPLQ